MGPYDTEADAHAETLAAVARTHGVLGRELANIIDAVNTIVVRHERIASRLRGMSSDITGETDGAWHSVWLHGNWRWLTKNMTTEQREAAADGVERYWKVLDDGTEDDASPETRAHLRWWRE